MGPAKDTSTHKHCDSLMGLLITSERKLAEAALPHILCTREWHRLHPTTRCPWRKDWQPWCHVQTGRVLLGIHITGCLMLEAQLCGSASTSGCPGWGCYILQGMLADQPAPPPLGKVLSSLFNLCTPRVTTENLPWE